VSEWTAIWLAVIALSTLLMAAIQVGALLYGARLVRRIDTTLDRVEHDLRPIFEQAHRVSSEAARMSALATTQVERVDQIFTDLTRRIDDTAAVIQEALIVPAREGAALFAALRSTLAALRGLRGNGRKGPPRGVEEDDALFIG
jgi:hypothetical protein